MKISPLVFISCAFYSQYALSFTSPFATKVATLDSKKTTEKKSVFSLSPPSTKGNKKNVPAKEKTSFNFQSFGVSSPNSKTIVKKNGAVKKPKTIVKKNGAVKKPVKASAKASSKADVKVSNFPSFGMTKPKVTTTNKKELKKNVKKVAKVPDMKIPEIPNTLKLPELPSFSLEIPSPVGIAGSGMQLLKPLFKAEAKLQAGVLVNVVDVLGAPFRVYPDEIRAATTKRISSTKPVLYTYGLSPFSGEAKNVLKDYDIEVIQVGPEWFLLGPEKSELRLALAENSEGYQTSLPHLFVKGESLGGLSTGGRNNAGILGLKNSGELEKLLKKRK